jgi:hypothetical protein
VLVTVDSARIAARAEGTDPWDAPGDADEGRRTLKALGTMLNIAMPSAGTAFSVLSELVPPHEDAAQDSYPDPRVRVRFNEAVGTRTSESDVLVNTIRPMWGYSFYVRLDSLREAGLDVAVVDDDGDGTASPQIGAVNVPRQKLEAVVKTGRLMTVEESNGELEQLMIRLEPVVANDTSGWRSYTLPLSQGFVRTHVGVPEGALVSVRVMGSGTVGGGFRCPATVTPAGIPIGGSEGDCRDYNLSGFDTTTGAPHGSGVVLFGTLPGLRAVSLVSGTNSEQCVRFVAPAYGPLTFAVNDRDFQNDSGAYTFEFSVSPPPDAAAPDEASGSPVGCADDLL